MRKRCGSSFLLFLSYPALLLLILFLSMPAAAKGEEDARSPGKREAAPYDYARSEVSVEIPDVTLVRTDGTRLSLRKILSDGRPVMAQFIFSTCPTICPVMSAVFATVREELGPERKNLRMVSFTIDPEHDTPEVLGEYARLFGADEEWFFLTGSFADMTTVQRAFGAYDGNKMNHAPYTFMRKSPGSPWVRVDEIMSAEDLGREAREMLGK
jgi:protein SCO1